MPWKVKGKTPDGNVVEVEIDKLPDGVLTEEQFTERFQEEIGRRLSKAEQKALTKALEDPEFKKAALIKWEINLAELAKGGEINAEKLQKAKADWAKSELEPVVTERDGLKGEIEGLLSQQLKAEILEAATKVGIRQQFLKSVGDGSEPMIVASTRKRYKWDPETKQHYEVDAKGDFVLGRSGKTPYRTVEESFTAFAENKENADFLDDKRPKGPGLGGTRVGGGDVVLTREQASDHSQYTAAEAQAKESGGRVVVQQ